MVKVYYAHPVTDYNKSREQTVLSFLEDQYGWEIYNPNIFFEKSKYEKLGMEYFKPFVQECDALVFNSFPNNRIGSGVALEIQWAMEKGIPVYEYDFNNNRLTRVIKDIADISYRILSIAETKDLIREINSTPPFEEVLKLRVRINKSDNIITPRTGTTIGYFANKDGNGVSWHIKVMNHTTGVVEWVSLEDITSWVSDQTVFYPVVRPYGR